MSDFAVYPELVGHFSFKPHRWHAIARRRNAPVGRI